LQKCRILEPFDFLPETIVDSSPKELWNRLLSKIEKLRQVATDIFLWDENYDIPDELVNNSDTVDLAILEQRRNAILNREQKRDDEIEKEIDDAIA
jgi:hypothetical protein